MTVAKWGGRRTYRIKGELREVALELEIDVSALLDRMGARAAENKTGKTALLGGIVKVTRKDPK